MAETASDLISNIEGYQQLLTTLSLGVAAGSFALLSQIMFHNAQHSQKVSLAAMPLVFLAMFSQMVAILCGVFTKSALVSSVPALHAIDWGSESAMVYLKAAGLDHIAFWSMMQILAFVTGIVLLFVVLILNRGMLR